MESVTMGRTSTNHSFATLGQEHIFPNFNIHLRSIFGTFASFLTSKADTSILCKCGTMHSQPSNHKLKSDYCSYRKGLCQNTCVNVRIHSCECNYQEVGEISITGIISQILHFTNSSISNSGMKYQFINLGRIQPFSRLEAGGNAFDKQLQRSLQQSLNSCIHQQ